MMVLVLTRVLVLVLVLMLMLMLMLMLTAALGTTLESSSARSRRSIRVVLSVYSSISRHTSFFGSFCFVNIEPRDGVDIVSPGSADMPGFLLRSK